MASKTDICNRALTKLGCMRSADIDNDTSEEAQVLAEMYDNVRDAVLQSNPWNFAVKRISIASDGTDPIWGYDKRYKLPNDCLGLLEIKNTPAYEIVGGYIETDATSPLYIIYISQVTDAAKYPATFVEALAARLDYEASERLTQSSSKKEAAARDYQMAVSAAYMADAIENPPDALPEDAWLDARL